MFIFLLGVPRHKRGEIWQYLAEQNRSWNNVKDDSEDFDMSYEELLKQLTSHQHSILIDIGKVFKYIFIVFLNM